MGKVRIGEWLWRFLAAVMLFTVAWLAWIWYQLNPPPLINADRLKFSDSLSSPEKQ